MLVFNFCFVFVFFCFVFLFVSHTRHTQRRRDAADARERESDEMPEGSFSNLPPHPDSADLAFYGGTAAAKKR